jgi:hypothetical protein
MALLVATLKPTALQGWSQFYRIKLLRGVKAWWEEIDERKHKTSPWRIWQPSDFQHPSEEAIGFWRSSGGSVTLLPPLFDTNPDGRSVRLDKVPWNFWEVCQRTTLTGPGVSLPDGRTITWVMGPGVPPARQLSCDDPLLRPTYCTDPLSEGVDPLKAAPVPGQPHRFFKIRILAGKGSSKTPRDADPTKAQRKTPSHFDSFDFEIVDLLSGASVVLHYSGKGTAGDSGLPGSNLDPVLLSPQPFTVFTTGGPVASLADFAGAARMTSDPKTGTMHLTLESRKLPPPPGQGPGLRVDLKAAAAPLPVRGLVNVGSETTGTLDFPDPKAELADILGQTPGAKRK